MACKHGTAYCNLFRTNTVTNTGILTGRKLHYGDYEVIRLVAGTLCQNCAQYEKKEEEEEYV